MTREQHNAHCYLSTPFWPVYSSNPVISKPVCKNTRVIEAKNIDVCPMDKVMRQNYNIAFSEPGADNTNLWWTKALQLINKLLRPSSGLHHSVIIYPVVVVHIVHVCCHHGVILRPRWPSGMLTLNKMQADIHMKPVAFWTLQLTIDTSQQFHNISHNSLYPEGVDMFILDKNTFKILHKKY